MLYVTNSDSKLKIHILSTPPFRMNFPSGRGGIGTRKSQRQICPVTSFGTPLWLPPTFVTEDLG